VRSPSCYVPAACCVAAGDVGIPRGHDRDSMALAPEDAGTPVLPRLMPESAVEAGGVEVGARWARGARKS